MRAHRRWTAPMKAPRPPPTMPRLSGRAALASEVASTMATPSMDAEHAAVCGLIGAGAGEIVEGLLGDADDVVGDEPGALARAVLRMLETAFPLQHGPAREVVLRELGEDRLEIDLAVAERAEAAGAIGPGLVAAIDSLTPRW